MPNLTNRIAGLFYPWSASYVREIAAVMVISAFRSGCAYCWLHLMHESINKIRTKPRIRRKSTRLPHDAAVLVDIVRDGETEKGKVE